MNDDASTRTRWQDTTAEELLDTAQRLSTMGCGCPDEGHQNALHDFVNDAARILAARAAALDALRARVEALAVEMGARAAEKRGLHYLEVVTLRNQLRALLEETQ